jgi:type IV secretory pathway VirB10-like protein
MSTENNLTNEADTNGQEFDEVVMPESTEDLQGPHALDMNAQPKTGRRLSKKIALLVLAFVLFVLLLIIFGIFSRGQKAAAARARADDKNMTSASRNAQEAELAVTGKINDQRKAARLAGGPSEAALEGAAPPDGLLVGNGPSAALKGDSSVPPLGAREIGQSSPRLPEATGPYGGHQRDGVVAPTFHTKTAEEKRREELYKLEEDALFAPTNVSSGGTKAAGGLGGLAGIGGGKVDPLSSLMAQLHPALGAGSGQPAGPPKEEEQNMQDRKVDFIETARTLTAPDYLAATRTMPMGAYQVKAGWDIPATLEQVVNTDLPGEIRALVRENVYDTSTGRYLLIPQGSRVLGKYDSHVAYGQSRVQVIWTRLIYPDGSSIDLGGMVGQDATGGSGFHDKVNNHYVRMFGMALMTSAFTAGIQLSQGSSTPTNATSETASQAATQALGQQMGELGIEIARKNMNIQPTITIPIGYRFNVRINRDIAFAKPYSAMGE